MADPLSGDRSVDSTNGAIEGVNERVIRAVDAPADEQTLADGDQTLADSDQTLSDTDQTGADGDQASADRDQVGADSDQDAADRDQAASDRDLGHGADPHAHEVSRDIRERTAREREHTAAARLETADERDAGACARDVAALARDRAAAERDRAAAQRDRAYEQELGSPAAAAADIVLRAADQRKRAALHRADAADYRALAAEERQAAVDDRKQAARDRLQALADRQALARQLAVAETDFLTGVRTRSAGLVDLEHEIDRSRRNSSPLVVAYVDVVGLKAVNDSEGHGAGDELIKRIVGHIRSHLRSYDLIVRVGGDEFVCAMSNMTLPEARERFGQVAGALAASPNGGAISTGFAELADQESAAELIGRADSELLAGRS